MVNLIGLWPEINLSCNIEVLQLWVMIADTVDDHMHYFINNYIEVNDDCFVFHQTKFLQFYFFSHVIRYKLILHLD